MYVLGIHVSPVLQEKSSRFDSVLLGRKMQRRPLVPICGIYICSMVQQLSHKLALTISRRVEQCGPTVAVCFIH